MASHSPPASTSFSSLQAFRPNRAKLSLSDYIQQIANVIEQTPTPPLLSESIFLSANSDPTTNHHHHEHLTFFQQQQQEQWSNYWNEIYSRYSHELFLQIQQILREYLMMEFPQSPHTSPHIERFLQEYVCELWWKGLVRQYDENVPHHRHHHSQKQHPYRNTSSHPSRVVQNSNPSQSVVSSVSMKGGTTSNSLEVFSQCERKLRDLLNTTCPNGGMKVLAVASASGYPHVVQWLIEMGCQIDSESPPGRRTPLFIAALKGHIQVVRVLLEKGASPHHESLFSDDVVMVSYYCGVVRQRVFVTPEKAAMKAGHVQLAQFIREFDLEKSRAKRRCLNKFYKHTKALCYLNDEERWFHGHALSSAGLKLHEPSLADITFTLL
ncbi:hypothetical protein C9374_000408 [Naegleria lovaniensis]|uniref:Uncharacterized protein n=1 Tax=Naegleria lovaniensis TaxID=51637 RepID=A0AA88GY87_NAELO|nr:uncharacterized protein C9374_000408 [Naegleria lovaniensis]KAG2388244.1 hypothetical protein C9374_000408 [Naegleria lovaniensis]